MILKEFEIIREPFKEVTDLIQGEAVVTISLEAECPVPAQTCGELTCAHRAFSNTPHETATKDPEGLAQVSL